jgi:hypothetical protein
MRACVRARVHAACMRACVCVCVCVCLCVCVYECVCVLWGGLLALKFAVSFTHARLVIQCHTNLLCSLLLDDWNHTICKLDKMNSCCGSFTPPPLLCQCIISNASQAFTLLHLHPHRHTHTHAHTHISIATLTLTFNGLPRDIHLHACVCMCACVSSYWCVCVSSQCCVCTYVLLVYEHCFQQGMSMRAAVPDKVCLALGSNQFWSVDRATPLCMDGTRLHR